MGTDSNINISDGNGNGNDNSSFCQMEAADASKAPQLMPVSI